MGTIIMKPLAGGAYTQDCIDFAICESRCPYQLPIREMLKKVHKDLSCQSLK